jgi:predicted small metal-binding protein
MTMTYKLACGDVMPGCSARFESHDRDQLMDLVGTHAATAHGVTDITPDVRRAIEGAIAVAA